MYFDPMRTGIIGAIHTFSKNDDVDAVRIGRVKRDHINSNIRQVVRDRYPGIASVRGFPDTATFSTVYARRADVNDLGIGWIYCHRHQSTNRVVLRHLADFGSDYVVGPDRDPLPRYRRRRLNGGESPGQVLFPMSAGGESNERGNA